MESSEADRWGQQAEAARHRWEEAGSARARCSVFSCVDPVPFGKDDELIGGGEEGKEQVLQQPIIVSPGAPDSEIRARPQDFEPVRVGYLVDIDTGILLGDCLDAALLAIEDVLDETRSYRPIEIVVAFGRGLPRRAARHTIAAYESLCDEGCLVVMGPYTTDGALAILPAMEERGVPCVSSNGAKAWHSRYGFTLGNGGVSEEGTMMADWCRQQGHTRVGHLVETSPGGAEYANAFRLAAAQNRLEIAGEILFETNGAGLESGLRSLRDDVQPEVLVYSGYGYPIAMVNPVLEALDWMPPRIQSTAFLWYIGWPSMLKDFEGWVGIDQIADDENTEGAEFNPNYASMVDRFERRFGRRTRHAMIVNSYDAMRAIVLGVLRANLLTPSGVVAGLETITMMPTTAGGPRTYVSFGPFDRKGYKGDFLTLRRVENGVPRHVPNVSRLLPSTIDDASRS